MTPDDSERLFRLAGDRAATRLRFLSWVLARYEEIESLGPGGLRERLGASEEAWTRLRLCLRPRPEAFLADVTRIASAFGIDRAALAAVVRRVDAVEAVRAREQPGQAGSLLAARTRKPRPPNPPEARSDD